MAAEPMVPARPERLIWIAPHGEPAEVFAERKPALERIACSALPTPFYSAKRRHLYRVEDRQLGPVGVKEIRNPSWLRRFWFRHCREHPGVREFTAGSRFEAGGGKTPSLLGAAVEQDLLTLSRVFIFLVWRDTAVTLCRHLAATPGSKRPAVLKAVAESMTAAARLGLVHGRHSCDNILAITESDGSVSYQPIDFAYSRMLPEFNPDGLASDASRVAFRLTVEDASNLDLALALLAAVARAAWPGDSRARWENTMISRFHETRHRYGYDALCSAASTAENGERSEQC